MSVRQRWRVAAAAQWVLRGGVIAYPTESVYGVGYKLEEA